MKTLLLAKMFFIEGHSKLILNFRIYVNEIGDFLESAPPRNQSSKRNQNRDQMFLVFLHYGNDFTLFL